ncbi:MAG: uracil-DNA glycosylase, partial [Alphaproteobacteria bacterium]|nr:uracil-DNA glycosylase [Alphaproteobacteria bacterium]
MKTTTNSGPVYEPPTDCGLCPRLGEFRQNNRAKYSGWHNAPVPAFGGMDGELLIVGLAPGLRGANQTGRPFTGDYAGDLLYGTLSKFGFTHGDYGAVAEDGLTLVNCRITNAVRCVPPENKPIGAEVTACREFLLEEITALGRLKVILALGTLAHGAVLATLGEKKSAYKFGHNQFHDLTGGLILADSYH